MGYELHQIGTGKGHSKTELTPSYVYNSDYWYWTMSKYEDSESEIYYVAPTSSLFRNSVYGYHSCVRPVIKIKKSALGDTNEVTEDNNNITGKNIVSSNDNSDKEEITQLKVPNTMQKISIILIMIGIILLSVSIVFVVKTNDKLQKKPE